jgi:hypothetical protein
MGEDTPDSARRNTFFPRMRYDQASRARLMRFALITRHVQGENDRLDMMAHMLNLVMGGKLHKSPIGDHPQRILDLGTGKSLAVVTMPDADAMQEQEFGP